MAKNTNGDSIRLRNKINIFLNNYFNLIAFVFFIVLLIAGYFFLVRPQYKEVVNKIKAAEETEEAEYSKQSRYLKDLKELEEEYNKISKNDVNRILEMVPYEKNHEILFAQMEKIVTENGYILSSLSIDDGGKEIKKNRGESTAINAKEAAPQSAKSGEIKKLFLRMSVIGTDYSGLKKLLSALENNLRLMDINNLSFDPAARNSSFEITAYFLQ